MTTKYYLNKNLDWVEIPELKEDKSIAQTFPQNYTFGIDEALDVAEFSFFAPEKYHIPVDSIIKINNDGIIKYWVVKDSKSSKMQYPNIWTQQMQRLNTLTLVEPIDLLRGFKVEPCAFAENSYTLEQIIKRLFDIANFDAEVEIPNINYNNPKLTYVSTTLYLVAFEIARTIDCIPYLDFNETTKKWILKFQKLDGLNGKEYDISIFSNPKDFVTEIGEGLAKNVYCEISNIRLTSELREPYKGFNKPTTTNNTSQITIDNIGFKLENNILTINELEIKGIGLGGNNETNTWHLIDNKVITFWVWNGTISAIPSQHSKIKTIKFINNKNYILLSNDKKENQDIIYIHYDEDGLIYLDELKKVYDKVGNNYETNEYVYLGSDLNDNGNPNISTMYGIISAPASVIYGNQRELFNNTFAIIYSGLVNRIIPYISSNDSKYDDIAYYNQTSQQVDSNRIGRVLQTYIDNMSYGSMMKSGVFYSWSEIPMPGSIIKDGNKRYLIDSITIEQKNKFANVDAQLCLERAKRRENMAADTTLQLNEIPNENLIDKLKLLYIKIKYSIKDNIINSSSNLNLQKNIFFISNKKIYFYKIKNNFVSKDESYILDGKTLISNIGNNIIFSEKAESNFIWNEEVDNDGNIIPRNYTDINGYIEEATITLKNEENQEIMNYTIKENPVKDPYEIFNFTFQINYRGVNNTIVREEYVEYLLNGVENPTYSIRLFDINIGKYDNLPSEYVAEIGSVSVSEFDEENNYISVDFTSVENSYKSIVLLLNDKPIMIKNYFEEQTGLSSFKIYLATEDGTPVRTGVMGIDPYEEESN